MTKKEARKKGWENGALNQVIPGMCIGGDYFGNYEGLLPENGDDYYECDIDTMHRKSRGAKRIIFTEDGDVWYTDDHYESFEQLYDGDE
jgi:guanyl-specific ribonuclease Sa